MRIVDAHHHLWDPSTIHYALFEAERLRPVTGAHRAEDFDAVALANGVSGALVVEAASAGADYVAETNWLFTEAARSSVTRCVIAYAPVERENVGDWLDALGVRYGERVAGIRRSFETVAPGFAFSDAVVTGIRAVAARGLPFDLVLFADRLGDVVELVRRVPEATFVLDHLGKPPLERRVQPEWKAAILALGRLPNVAAKVSGLITETPNGAWDDALVRPYIDHAVACFGWERLMFGSDWPICDLAGGYGRWLDFVADASARDVGAEAPFFSGAAERIYGSVIG
jgi:L-fuconolactonase